MSLKIQDGHGNGYEARVDSLGRLFVLGVSETPIQHSSMEGDAYILTIPIITLTTANASGILYIKNEDPSRLMVLQELRTFLGAASTTGNVELIGYKNPTGGTLISGGTAKIPVNQNLGSSVPSLTTAKYGAEGSTVTGGTEIIGALVQDKTSPGVVLDFAVPNGNSFAVTVKPPAGNTSMALRMRIAFFFDTIHVGV